MIIVLAKEEGQPPIPEAFEEPDHFEPKSGVEYIVLFDERDSVHFITRTIKRLVEAKVEFTVWEFGSRDDITPTGTTQLW